MFGPDEKSQARTLSREEGFSVRKKTGFKDVLFLSFSVGVLVLALSMVVASFLGIVSDGKEIGDIDNPVTWVIFFSGGLINFFCVPILYWSSYYKFREKNDFWDTESFWILPLSFFGSFFQYISDLPHVVVILPFSLSVIMIIHILAMINSGRLVEEDDQLDNRSEYFRNLGYLTAYYLLLLAFVISFDFFGKMRYWLG